MARPALKEYDTGCRGRRHRWEAGHERIVATFRSRGEGSWLGGRRDLHMQIADFGPLDLGPDGAVASERIEGQNGNGVVDFYIRGQLRIWRRGDNDMHVEYHGFSLPSPAMTSAPMTKQTAAVSVRCIAMSALKPPTRMPIWV
jgi:hypothetical protein